MLWPAAHWLSIYWWASCSSAYMVVYWLQDGFARRIQQIPAEGSDSQLSLNWCSLREQLARNIVFLSLKLVNLACQFYNTCVQHTDDMMMFLQMLPWQGVDVNWQLLLLYRTTPRSSKQEQRLVIKALAVVLCAVFQITFVQYCMSLYNCIRWVFFSITKLSDLSLSYLHRWRSLTAMPPSDSGGNGVFSFCIFLYIFFPCFLTQFSVQTWPLRLDLLGLLVLQIIAFKCSNEVSCQGIYISVCIYMHVPTEDGKLKHKSNLHGTIHQTAGITQLQCVPNFFTNSSNNNHHNNKIAEQLSLVPSIFLPFPHFLACMFRLSPWISCHPWRLCLEQRLPNDDQLAW